MSSQNKQPDVVTTIGGVPTPEGFALELDATFAGYNPPLTGSLSALFGSGLAAGAANSAHARVLSPLLAATTVANPNVALDLTATLPASGLFGATTIDVGVVATGAGLAGVLQPLLPGLAGSGLASDLNALLPYLDVIVPGLGGAYIPTTGTSVHAASDVWILGSAGAGVGLTGGPTLSGTYAFANPNALAQFATAVGNLTTSTTNLLNDVASGALLPAVFAATSVAGAVTALTTAVTGLSLGGTSHAALPALAAPAVLQLDAGIAGSAGASVPVLGTFKLSDQIKVDIQADQAGSYALGQILAQAAPSLVASLSSGGPAPNPLTIISGLAGSLSKLLVDSAGSLGTHGTTSATTTPSSVDKPDLVINIQLGLSETLGLLPVTSSQSLDFGIALNAAGAVKLGSDLVPVIGDLLPILLKTSLGSEILQIAGKVLSQTETTLGLAPAPAASASLSHTAPHPLLLAHA